ncbi:hypothetical protein C8J55DRAFT_544503 [Lentinula edodes]|uniref:Uncharacterized protein n=1 Tax=Lentinula lateritia TaxID=40482 RepID=A0A9W8ZTL9_9AGAR|nr:hypothetical protein C8J55DRAFT_544503 [Lentinula edodes]
MHVTFSSLYFGRIEVTIQNGPNRLNIADGLLAIRNNIQENHNGFLKGPWNLAIKSFRSTLSQTPGIHLPLEPPTRADVVQAIADKTTPPNFHPTHYRTTFLTLNPPGALEQLLAQLKARWVPVRQTSTNNAQRGQASGHQLLIKGQTGPAADGTSELLSNLLTSVLPNVPDAKTVAVTISEAQWEDVLWDREEDEKAQKEVAQAKERESNGENDDIFVYGLEDIPIKRRGDWTGVDRDRRSAFLAIGDLKSEGIL